MVRGHRGTDGSVLVPPNLSCLQCRMELALLLFYALWFICLQGLSLLLVGSSQYGAVLQSSFGHVLLWKRVHPNLSVLWYLNMEVFERYRVYFAILIGGLPYLLLVPITLRLHRFPMVLVSCCHSCFYLLWRQSLIADMPDI